MTDNIRFVHCADLHCGLTSYSKENEIRLIDWQNAFYNMIEYVKSNNIPYVFICGDLFHQNIPSIEALVVANQCLFQLSQVCQYIFLVAGNHDINSISKKRHILQSITLKNIILLDETKLYSNEEWPFNVIHYHYLNVDKSIESLNDKPNIVTFHGTVSGAKDDLGNYAGEPHITLDKLISSNPLYVALGHIHKRQLIDCHKYANISTNIPIAYPGSFIQTSFSERGNNKGFSDVFIDSNNVNIEFVKNPYIEYIVVDSLINLTKEKIKDKIVRIDIPMTINLKEIYKDVLKTASFVTYNAIKDIEILSDNINEANKQTIKFEELDIAFLIKSKLTLPEQELLKSLMG